MDQIWSSLAAGAFPTLACLSVFRSMEETRKLALQAALDASKALALVTSMAKDNGNAPG